MKLVNVKNALCIAQQCSIMNCDHLINLSKNIFTDNDIAKVNNALNKIQCYNKKCYMNIL